MMLLLVPLLLFAIRWFGGPWKRVRLAHYAQPRAVQEKQARLMRAMARVARALDADNIPYWLTAGSMLGAARHAGMIPWDDDIDLGVWADDLPRVARCVQARLGVELGSFPLPRIPLGGWEWIDVIPYTTLASQDGQQRRSGPTVWPDSVYARTMWPREGFYAHELTRRVWVDFGELRLPVPAGYVAALDRWYPNWREEAVLQDHDIRHFFTQRTIRVRDIDDARQK